MKQIFKNTLFRIGFAIAVLGSSPLLLTMLAASLGLTDDPNPNPVFFGIIATLTFWPGIIMMGIGVYMAKRGSDKTSLE